LFTSRRSCAYLQEQELTDTFSSCDQSSAAERFANLNNLKRNPNDERGQERRRSIQEQMVGKQGFLGKMWNEYALLLIYTKTFKANGWDKQLYQGPVGACEVSHEDLWSLGL